MIQIIHDKSLYEHTTSTQEGATYRFFVRDHLGNSRAVLDTQGNLISQFNFEPYGVELLPLGNNGEGENPYEKYKYTGQERDYSTGLDYMHFRFYASSIGRFLRPDNLIPDITNPQNWNAYSYVKGNPVNFNDPSGHYGEDVHLDLTEVLAEAAGFSETDARVIGVMDQGVDEKFPAGLWSDNNALYHFTTEERRDELWNQFEESGSLEDLGTYLHAEQDSFSHAGYNAGIGHLFDGKSPDNTAKASDRALIMAWKTFSVLSQTAKVKRIGVEKIAWEKIEKNVLRYVQAKSKKDKVKILSEIKRIIKQEEQKRKKTPPQKIPHKSKIMEMEQYV